MQGNSESSDNLRTISAWDVFRSRRAPHPPNPLRYSHSFWYAFIVLALAIALTVAVIPASSVESDMLQDARQAKADGFPDLPPGHASREELDEWIDDTFTPGVPFPSSSITEMSVRVGDYEDDSAVLNLGVMGSLAALVFLAAIGFGRALNNLYALGYGASVLSPAWAFVSWLLPILSFVIPWRMVSEVFQCAWNRPGEDPQSVSRWPQVVAALWGISFVLLWIFNPVSINIFSPRNDIDQWINHIQIT